MQEEKEKPEVIGNSVTCVTGVVLKFNNKYVCWNSFKSEYYLGSRDNVEIFSWTPLNKNNRFEEAFLLYPKAKKLYIGTVGI